jgi:microcin C transport system substrate-binding protein
LNFVRSAGRPLRSSNPHRTLQTSLLATVFLLLAGCRQPTPPADMAYDPQSAWRTLGLSGTREDFEKSLAPLDKVILDKPTEVGTGYDPKFPGDIPFKPEAWTTATPSTLINDPRARKGGTLRLAITDWPPTLRTEGPNSRLKTTSDMHNLVFETLLDYDVDRGTFLPRLATHWQVGPDRKTFRFRLDPRARWSDGRPVTSDDVKATLEHLMRKDRKDPSVADSTKELIADVRLLDRQTVEVVAREPRWRTLVTIGLGTNIYPAAYIRMDGETYLSEWNWRLPPGTGPYSLSPQGLLPGRTVTFARRHDWWGDSEPTNAGKYNFDTVVWSVVRDQELEFQKFMAGEFDAHRITRAQRWVDELDKTPAVSQGWVQKRKIFSLEPEGYSGYCFNMRQAPFDNVNVRAAFAHLFNRELLFEKFFYFQYDYVSSYFPGQIYARPDAQRIRFDPPEARRLLAQAGWVRRDAEGFLVNGRGERFPVLQLGSDQGPSFERLHQVYKDDLWRETGIKLDIKNVDYASHLKQIWEYKFSLVFFNWTASLFPDMEPQFAGKYAKVPQTNNLNGFRNAEADRLMEAYKTEFDQAKRLQMMHRLDEILFDQHPYALAWHAPYWRVLYWDKFGHPPEYGERFIGEHPNIVKFWWIDPEKERKTEQNRTTGKANYPGKPLNQYDDIEVRYWLDHAEPRPDSGRAEAWRKLGVTFQAATGSATSSITPGTVHAPAAKTATAQADTAGATSGEATK